MPLFYPDVQDVKVDNWPTGRRSPDPYSRTLIRVIKTMDWIDELTVPVGEEWVVKSICWMLATAAVVGDRYYWVRIIHRDPSLATADTLYYMQSQHAFAVNESYIETLAINLPYSTFDNGAVGGWSSTAPLPDVRLAENDSITFKFVTHAGDTGVLALTYERYVEKP